MQVSHIKLVAGRLIVARLDGQLDFLELVSNPAVPIVSGNSRPRSSTSTDSLASWGEVTFVDVTISALNIFLSSCDPLLFIGLTNLLETDKQSSYASHHLSCIAGASLI